MSVLEQLQELNKSYALLMINIVKNYPDLISNFGLSDDDASFLGGVNDEFVDVLSRQQFSLVSIDFSPELITNNDGEVGKF